MADSGSHPSKTQPQKAQQNPMTPFANFIYKAIFVCVLIALLPIFTSQSPEVANKTIITRSWELLHLLLVGIAISYGLFSRRNTDHDVDKEAQPKYDNTPQSYVSQVLQVSSVFDEEEAIESPRGPEFPDETESQTWNYSQYNRGEPVVMVAKENTEGSKVTTKPLFLPVRSLKSVEGDEDGGKAGVVLPSPIPWRSRSGRMEVKEALSPSISAFEAELGPSRVPSFRSSTPRSSASGTPSPRRLSPSPSMSSEIRAKTSEDSGRKKSFYKSSPPPPPPPPPQPLVHGHNIATEKKDGSKSFKYELEHLSMRGRGKERFLHRDELGLDPSEATADHYGGRSVRTVRSKEAQRSRTLPANKSKKKNEFREKMIIESDSSHSDAESEISDVGELPNPASAGAGTEENEVDKKADEFIAKFREQIRLQRIASIKRSTAQRNVRSQS
ncbi:MICAL C-terminal-like protein [Iris pallida]|uniref:MICAL C-terminal-like protein n=1 Tax=Iris pallida TaxID=29817 RepID=A0AAX6DHN5_IRIPA|nr:MICAL C-terminal-like protein [Iris pallida]